AFYLRHGKNNGHSRWPLRPLDLSQPTDFLLQNVFVEEQERAQRLVLSGSGHVANAREMAQEFGDFSFSHFGGMTFLVKKDKPFNPIDVSLLCPERIMFDAYGVTNLLEQFRFAGAGRRR